MLLQYHWNCQFWTCYQLNSDNMDKDRAGAAYSFPILDISSLGIRSLSIQYVTINYLVGTNQSEIANFWPVTNITTIIWENAVLEKRSFPILDISSLGIRSISVQYVKINYLVGTNQSEIANFWPVTNITTIIWENAVLEKRNFPILDISSLGIRTLGIQYVKITYLVGRNQSEIANFGPVTNLTAII